ncbi:MAG: XTP/dITP diphosphatase [Endomicrobiales bacterium]|nr:XTP/dITP diphosphatase [Endomicrobiales bacterium]
MKEIVLATRNKHKVREITEILGSTSIKVLSLSDFKKIPEVVEDGSTLEENAVKKARVIALRLKRWTLADDTGLEVSYLNGAPGVYSARFAGPGCSYEDNNKKLLELLEGLPAEKRKAKFRCVIALSDPKGKARTAEGSVTGVIAERTRGRNGFGYDPLFFIPRYKKTFAELDSGTKNRISHRGKALKKASKIVKKLFS